MEPVTGKFYKIAVSAIHNYIKDERSGCLEYQGCLDKDGYGVKTIGGKQWRLPRLVWIIAYGSIPDGKIICHHCDNPSCVNVQHLFVGTHKENNLDMFKKGRANRLSLEKHPHSKLKNQQVKAIRNLYKSGFTMTRISKMFGISIQNTSEIVHRKTWKALQ